MIIRSLSFSDGRAEFPEKRSFASQSCGDASAFTKNVFILLGSFALLVALFGGASRYEEVQVAVLRPIAALFLIGALWRLNVESIRDLWVPVGLLFGLSLWMALQLVPLPPAMWRALPIRGVLAEIDVLLGLEGHWRPISFVPSRTLNALASLVVPVCALLLMIVQPRRELWLVVLLLITGVGVLDATLGISQVLTGISSPLYLYDVTNHGSPVGLFANENHSAVFSVISMLIAARLATIPRVNDSMRWMRFAAGPVFVLIFLSVLLSGSRSGLALGGLALMASALMVWMARYEAQKSHASINRALFPNINRKIVFWSIGGSIAISLLIFFLFERAPAFEDLLSQNRFEDLRARIFPVLREMVATFWLFGAGFGSFEEVYHIFEPTSLLIPPYINQAHNDWAQLVIEGGLPAIVFLLFTLGWILSILRRIIVSRGTLALGVFWITVGLVLAAASVVDYPLRTPIFQVLGVWLLVILVQDGRVAE